MTTRVEYEAPTLNGNFVIIKGIVDSTANQVPFKNKKAVLSQRRPRNAFYISLPWKFSRVPDYAHGYFSRHFWWTFVPIIRSIPRICIQNLTFVALPVP